MYLVRGPWRQCVTFEGRCIEVFPIRYAQALFCFVLLWLCCGSLENLSDLFTNIHQSVLNLVFVTTHTYLNNTFTKDRCPIPVDMTVVLGLHQFSLQANTDHHEPSMYSGHYTASFNGCQNTFYCNDSKITEFEKIDTKNSSTAYLVMYNLIT